MEPNIHVHGSIFFLLKKFVSSLLEINWEELMSEADLKGAEFEMTKSYPIAEIGAIMARVSERTGQPVNILKERFGEYLVPDLFRLYANYLKPEWKTYDVILNTELVMHGAVRRLNSAANPPILSVQAVTDELLIIDYFSKRRMASLAVGIIKGIAKYYNEEDKVIVNPTTDPDDERVQIRVEFSK